MAVVMNGWMDIGGFLREVDRLARLQSARLDHEVAPPAEAPGSELSEFTRHLLHAARGDAFEASDSPTVQTLEVHPNRSSTRCQFWAERPEAA
jgi:hypothetical protein